MEKLKLDIKFYVLPPPSPLSFAPPSPMFTPLEMPSPTDSELALPAYLAADGDDDTGSESD